MMQPLPYRAIMRRVLGDAGFTLLELIVVLAILALAAVMALPAVERSRRGQPMRTTAIDLASALKGARAEALRSNSETRLEIDLAHRRFSADGMAAPHPLPRDVVVAYEVPVAEQAGEGVASIRFRPDGSSSGGTITVSAHRQSAVVSVDWLTGRTTVAWGR